MLTPLEQLELDVTLRECRDHLSLFCRYVRPGFIHGAHLTRIISAMQRIERGETKRLMVMAPPRHGKSEIISKLFPCWYLGRHPEREIIQTGYSDDMACFHSRNARRIFVSQRFNEVFPGVSRPIGQAEAKSQAIKEWFTLKGGSYRAAGIMSGISGRGADVILIDDPVKNSEEANSATVREAILNEYRETLLTRLSPIGAVVLIMTRWHQDDLAGRLMAEMQAGGDQWEVIKLQAIDAHEKALWPERFDIDWLKAKRKSMGTRAFAALYQQDPKPPGAGLFKREWFEIVDAAPACSRMIRYWDRAGTEPDGTNDPDWTAGVLYGRADNGTFYVLHVNRFQGSPFKVESSIKNTASQDGKAVQVGIEQDPGQAGKADGMNYVRLLAEYPVKLYPATKSKVIRAQAVIAQAEAGNVKLVRGSWNEAFLQECENFAGGDEKNDQIDALSGAHNAIAPSQRLVWA